MVRTICEIVSKTLTGRCPVQSHRCGNHRWSWDILDTLPPGKAFHLRGLFAHLSPSLPRLSIATAMVAVFHRHQIDRTLVAKHRMQLKNLCFTRGFNGHASTKE